MKISKIYFLAKKKLYTLSFPILGGRNSTKALQYSPFQNPGGGGGYPERDAEVRTNGRNPRV